MTDWISNNESGGSVRAKLNAQNAVVTTNTSDIATNAAAISTLNSTVVSLSSTVTSLSSTVGTNTANIATNTANIATNTTNIATNTTNIAALTPTGAITGANVDVADKVSIFDTSASAYKTLLLNELKVALGIYVRPPTTSLFSFSADGSGVTSTITYDAGLGYSFVRTDGGTGAERISFRGKAVPASSPWTAQAKINIAVLQTSGSAIYAAGMALYASGSGKFMLFGVQYINGTFKLNAAYFSSLTTFVSETTVTITPNFPAPIDLRIVESSTAYNFDYSLDGGQVWVTLATELKATHSFTADKVGVCNNTSTAVTAINGRPTINVKWYADNDFPFPQ